MVTGADASSWHAVPGREHHRRSDRLSKAAMFVPLGRLIVLRGLRP